MTPSKFLIFLASFPIGIMGFVIVLFLVVDLFVIPDYLPSYHQLLLENIPSPRIIIDSGSNSRHNIDPKLMETELSIPTIVVADNINVPLQAKIFRIEKYANTGDIIILPLEWQFYFRDDYPSIFFDWLIDAGKWFDFSDYYYDFPFTEKVTFSLDRINLEYVVAGLIRRLTESSRENLQKRFELVVTDKNMGAYGDVKGEGWRVREVGNKTCHQFIWPTSTRIPSVINWAADRLAALQRDRGVRIVLTWPAIAGTNCYDPESEVVPRVASIRAIFERVGIAVVGDPARSVFSDEHMLDTYYHIDSTAARERTRRIIEDLRIAGLAPKPTRILPISSIMDAALERQERGMIQSLRPLQTGVFSPGKGSFGSYFRLSREGWYGIEGSGVWSRGGLSKIYLRSSEKNCKMTLRGVYATNNHAVSRISINSHFVEADAASPIIIPQTDGIVEIGLEHRDFTSPKDRGVSDDTRSLAYYLAQINVDCTP